MARGVVLLAGQVAALACGLIAGRLLAADGTSPRDDAVRSWVQAHEADVLREFRELLSIPNLASDGPNIRRNAEHIARMLARRGISARLLDGEGGPPVVYGEVPAPGARRTVVVYAHYDGQPVDAAKWASPPWTPVLRDGPLEGGGREVSPDGRAGPMGPEWRLYARSAGDDKAPIVAVLAALDALKATGAKPSLNLKLFFEGEEEAGSPHLGAVLARNKELLKADAWLLCDGPVHQTRRPQIFFGVRGVTDVEITLYGPARALHSGHYGNWAPNPAVALAHLVAGLRDTDGRIRVPGFYDDVRPATTAERLALQSVPEVDDALRRELSLAETEAGGARLAERILLPALNVRGLEAGAVGEGAANAIPVEARASIDFRLVPNQTPARVRELFESHLRAQGYTITHATPTLEARRAQARLVTLAWGAGYPPARAEMDSPFARALVTSVESAVGPVVRMPTLGGSIPMYLFVETFGVPVVGLPIANHDDNQHAANENLRLQNLWDGTSIFASVLGRLGEEWR
ncbi:MAG: M20/M25/M40 family metallo-hydrolase [Solirubrobacterales bacterium]|jgi:acetylornithine deacetylase/succinyl-diaminopimelate desuccinylase-like protein